MAKCGFFKGIKRCNMAIYGDLEGGDITKLKSGKLTLTVEGGKALAWIVGSEDLELSKDNIQSLESITAGAKITDLASGGGKPYVVNIYRITMTDGATGTLRLVVNSEARILPILQ